MLTTIKDIKLTRGDSFGFNFEVADSEGNEVELDACYFSCKERPDDTEYIFQKSLNNGITKLSEGYYVKLKPADTTNMEYKAYYYDLQATIGDDVITFLKGKLDIKWDITRE